jgi:hypothetical protein
VLQDLPEIVDRDGNTIHAAKSWVHLASRVKAKSDSDGPAPLTSKANATETSKTSKKGKGKEKEKDPVTEDDDNGGWVTEVDLDQVFIHFLSWRTDRG